MSGTQTLTAQATLSPDQWDQLGQTADRFGDRLAWDLDRYAATQGLEPSTPASASVHAVLRTPDDNGNVWEQQVPVDQLDNPAPGLNRIVVQARGVYLQPATQT